MLGHLGGLILAVMAGAVFLQVGLRFLGRVGIDGLDEVPRYLFVWLVMIGAAAAMQRGEHTVLDYFVNLPRPRAPRAGAGADQRRGHRLFVYLIKLSLVLVPNAQLQIEPGARVAARLCLRRHTGRLGPHHPADAPQPHPRPGKPMAETLLIVFIVFILLGMPISIAMGVGALGAAIFYPVLNPIIIPTRFVGLLSDSYLLLSAPLFILAGNIAARGGVARVIIDLATALVGRFRGGLAYVNVVDSMFFGGISGLGRRRRLRARHVPHPADGAQGLRPRLRHRADRQHRGGGADHPSLHHRRDLCVDGGRVGGGDVRRRRDTGAAGRHRHGGAGVRHRQEAQLSAGSRRRRCPSSWRCCARRCRR